MRLIRTSRLGFGANARRETAMFNLAAQADQSSASPMIEALEDRLCFSSATVMAGATLSPHDLHLRHLSVLARQNASSGIAGTTVTLSAHQRHVARLNAMASQQHFAVGMQTSATQNNTGLGTNGEVPVFSANTGLPVTQKTSPFTASSFDPASGNIKPFGGVDPVTGSGSLGGAPFSNMTAGSAFRGTVSTFPF
jgi:hypothetical protein